MERQRHYLVYCEKTFVTFTVSHCRMGFLEWYLGTLEIDLYSDRC